MVLRLRPEEQTEEREIGELGEKKFSRPKKEPCKTVSRGKGTQFWKTGARSRRASVRNGMPMNDC